jgi:hypothetical protein
MCSHPFRLTAFVDGDRNAVTTRIRAAVSEAGAWITDVYFFSGMQTVFGVDVERTRLPGLVTLLERIGLEFDDESRSAIARARETTVESLEGTLAVMFRQGDPHLRREVPAVPG